MDSPLVLTSKINPSEVDDMVHGLDVVWSYPLEFYEAALQYSKQRVQFGKPIASFQSIQNMLVEMRTLIDASKLLCYRALSMSADGRRPDAESSMAKYFSCEAALRVTNLAVEVHGAFGITRAFPVEKYFRDARVLAFPDGTIGIQKLIVGREITGIRAFS